MVECLKEPRLPPPGAILTRFARVHIDVAGDALGKARIEQLINRVPVLLMPPRYQRFVQLQPFGKLINGNDHHDDRRHPSGRSRCSNGRPGRFTISHRRRWCLPMVATFAQVATALRRTKPHHRHSFKFESFTHTHTHSAQKDTVEQTFPCFSSRHFFTFFTPFSPSTSLHGIIDV